MTENGNNFHEIPEFHQNDENVKHIQVQNVKEKKKSIAFFKYVVKMFSTENSVRPRHVGRSLWSDTKGTPHFEAEAPFRLEIPMHDGANDNGSDSKDNKSRLTNFIRHLEEYFSNSTLHGLKYVGEPTISVGERLFWFLSFCCAICFATYFISSIYSKYNLNPVIMSLNPTPTPLSSLPFPALTVCSMNQAKKWEAEQILATGTEVEKMLLDDYCNSNNSFTNTPSVNDEATKWDNVMKFILKVSPSCQEMLKVCLWRQEEMDCLDLFNNILTDEGLCCTFNALPRSKIFQNPKILNDLNLTYPGKIYDWTPENGYNSSATNDSLPWRAAGAGTHLGLTLVLDAALHSYYCSSTSSYGFKLLLHNPIETPKMADFAFLASPGKESRFVILPKIFDATSSLRSISYIKRMCFFANERNLLFYRTYTERNCKLECQSNYTLQLCGCVPFYLPKNRLTKICGKMDESCSDVAKDSMDMPHSNGTTCNCLPSCFEIEYDAVGSHGTIGSTFRIKENIIKNENIAYFVKNMAILHFYFVESQFIRNTKSELYGFSEFLSNTGGLLGLFMGFSFLSIVEVLYYVSLKLFCSFLRSNNRTKSKRNQIMTKDATVVYPFAK